MADRRMDSLMVPAMKVRRTNSRTPRPLGAPGVRKPANHDRMYSPISVKVRDMVRGCPRSRTVRMKVIAQKFMIKNMLRMRLAKVFRLSPPLLVLKLRWSALIFLRKIKVVMVSITSRNAAMMPINGSELMLRI